MSKTHPQRSARPRALLRSGAAAGLATVAAFFAAGCLERPVVKQEPRTSNVFVQQIINQEIDKIDLLFVVDNSVSMGDKQIILQDAVPEMVNRLVTPNCVNEETGAPTGQVANADGECAAGKPEFKPIKNIHIGVISSSLGGHGSTQCQNAEGIFGNDRGLLMPKVRPALSLPTNNPEGFLVWRPVATDTEGVGETDAATLAANFEAHVVASGENGCGYEAQLESWYRFLVDPQPPREVAAQQGAVAPQAADEDVLRQRAAFLRPDSLVAIIVLSDEDDCSALEGGVYYANAGFGWLVTDPNQGIAVATSVCAANPNDPCCYSCFLDAPPAECKNASIQAECTGKPTIPRENDNANHRCVDNKRRFGFDLLYPTQRYVDGLTKETIVNSQTGEEVPNPLLVNGTVRRDPSFVFFAGIVGVPWQDLATPETLADPDRLEYLKAAQLAESNVAAGGRNVSRWDLLLGNPGLPADSKTCLEFPNDARCLSGRVASDGETSCVDSPTDPACVPTQPLDPFMIVSIPPRTTGAANPITNDTINPVGSTTFNAINGHEFDTAAAAAADSVGELQYACIFDLRPFGAEKTDCTADNRSCDCGSGAGDRPLCKAGPGDPAGTSQFWGKAYPGTRILQVLRDFGDNAIVASICPKISTEGADDYGYNPAVGAIVDRLAEKLGGPCLPRKLQVDPDTQEVPCKIVEALNGAANCGLAGRGAVEDEKLAEAVRQQLEELGLCGEGAGSTCEQWNMCEIRRVDEGDIASCQNQDPYSGASGGYCYIDPAQGLGSPTLVQQCDATKRQQLRFVPADGDATKIPLKESVTFVACTAEQVTE